MSFVGLACALLLPALAHAADTIISFSTDLKNTPAALKKAGTKSALPFWNGSYNPGAWVNDTGKTLVLYRLDFHLSSAAYGIEEADTDLCLNSPIPPVGVTHTTTQSEILCATEHLKSGEWPKTDWKIDFPAQGQIIQPGQLVLCDSGVSFKNFSTHKRVSTRILKSLKQKTVTLRENGHRVTKTIDVPVWTKGQKVADFGCTLHMRPFDPSSSLPAVQSLRVPFADQSFYQDHSFGIWHTNLSQAPLRSYGFWIYANSKGQAVTTELLVHHRKQDFKHYFATYDPTHGAPADQASNVSWHSQDTWQPFADSFQPGEQFGAQCTIKGIDKDWKICAFYFMVEVEASRQYQPLHSWESIDPAAAKVFCDNGAGPVFLMSEFSGNSNLNLRKSCECQDFLLGRSTPAQPTATASSCP
jgi:hypothetical protein